MAPCNSSFGRSQPQPKLNTKDIGNALGVMQLGTIQETKKNGATLGFRFLTTPRNNFQLRGLESAGKPEVQPPKTGIEARLLSAPLPKV